VECLDGAVGLRPAGADQGVSSAELAECGAECAGAELAAVVGEQALQAPARRLQLGGDAAGEPRGVPAGRVALCAADELGPGVGGGDVDRGQLPDRAFGAGEPADEEAVDPP
jgi:hypothetical protein